MAWDLRVGWSPPKSPGRYVLHGSGKPVGRLVCAGVCWAKVETETGTGTGTEN